MWGRGRTCPDVALATTISRFLYAAPLITFFGGSDVKPGFSLDEWGDNMVLRATPWRSSTRGCPSQPPHV